MQHGCNSVNHPVEKRELCPLKRGNLFVDIRISWKHLCSIGIRLLVLVPLLTWIIYYRRGKLFVLRDRLWNLCMQTHTAARVTQTPWPRQRELEQAQHRSIRPQCSGRTKGSCTSSEPL